MAQKIATLYGLGVDGIIFFYYNKQVNKICEVKHIMNKFDLFIKKLNYLNVFGLFVILFIRITKSISPIILIYGRGAFGVCSEVF